MTTRVHRESAQLRRDALLRAAVEIVAESGTGAATHRAIAARAGVPAATTSYFFSSIDELLVEATRRFTGEQAAAYQALAADLADASIADVAAGFAAALMRSDRIVELAQVEAYLHAARDPGLRTDAAAVMDAFRAVTVDALAGAGVADPVPVARAITAMVDGFLLQHLAVPRPDDEASLREALETMLDAHLRRTA